ncbi:DUF3311 domain-containing protein [Natronomonas sp. F2-12]|uniref:DUF3311 domain-containing protein n=1 Tax=Natronomonas aquatica TaxID=2841590 RepID=A0A9R1D6Z3_9EURY|nr:DUF3311 domain-containing protein [Natronomonas aquatica]MCQ4333802.1 DUF3311 domain-containing protein [Natronomonas aquatica]
MASMVERYGWAVLIGLLITFAIPWFLWGDSRTAFGLPLWLWWHVGWMLLAAVAFRLFARRAWGLWIVESEGETA